MKPYYETKLGRLYCGDCLEIMPELEPVDLVLTDPPYGLNKKMQGGSWGVNHSHGDMMEWDYLLKPEDFKKIIQTGNIQIVWGGNYYNVPPSRCWLLWLKPEIPTLSDIEMAWTNIDAPAKVVKISRQKHNGHPTSKPPGLMVFCIEKSKTTGIVLDPFMGSGTTAIACEELKRNWIGIEISEKYCEIAAKRIEKENQQLRLC